MEIKDQIGDSKTRTSRQFNGIYLKPWEELTSVAEGMVLQRAFPGEVCEGIAESFHFEVWQQPPTHSRLRARSPRFRSGSAIPMCPPGSTAAPRRGPRTARPFGLGISGQVF